MKNFKKVIAGALALLMLALSVNVSFAATDEYNEAEAIAVAKVNAAGIMTGTDKGFEPSKTLTRAEAAAIMVRMKGISEDTAKQSAGTTLFNDVAASHWAAGYVNVASNYGIIKGVGANKFAPEKEVTVAEFYTMAIRALGAGQLVDSEGVWPTNYVNFAIENDLAEDVAQIHTATSTRKTAAVIVANTLEAKMWEKVGVKSNGEIEWGKTDPAEYILTNVLKLKPYLNKKCTDVSIKDQSLETEAGTFDVKDGVDLSNIRIGVKYDFWTNDRDDVVGIWEAEKSDLTKVNFTKISKVTTDKVTLAVDGKDKEYKLNDEFAYVLNGDEKNLTKNDSNVFGVAYIDNGKLSSIYGEKYTTYAIVDEVKTKSVTFATKNVKVSTDADEEGKITVDEEKYDYFFTKDGEGIKVTDLKEGDAIAFYTTDEKYVGVVIEAAAEGKVTAKSATKSTVKIDGTSYDVVDDLMDALKNDLEVKVYTNNANKVVMFETIEDAASDVAIVKSVRGKYSNYSDETNELEVVLQLTDGTTTEALLVDNESTFDEFESADLATVYTIDDINVDTPASGKTTIEFVDSDETCVADNEWAAGLHLGDKIYYVKATDKYYTKKAYAGHGLANDMFSEGVVICYEISGNKLTVLPYDLDEPEFLQVADASLTVKNNSAFISFDDTDVDDAFDLVDSEDIEALVKTGKFEVNENTKFFKLKSEDKSYYSLKVEEIAFEDLDSDDYDDITIADIDYDDMFIGIVVFDIDASIARSTETNFVFVENYFKSKNAKTIEVIDLKGEKASYTVDDEFDDYSKINEDLIGSVLDVKVSGEELVGINLFTIDGAVADDTLNAKTIVEPVTKINSKKTAITLENETLAVADDCLVLCYNADKEKYTVKDIADISEFDSEEDDNNVLTFAITYTEKLSDHDTEAILLVYVEQEAYEEYMAKTACSYINKHNATYEAFQDGNKVTIRQKSAAATGAVGTEIEDVEISASNDIDFKITKAGTTAVKAEAEYTFKLLFN